MITSSAQIISYFSAANSGAVGTGAALGPVINVKVPSLLCPGCTAVGDGVVFYDGVSNTSNNQLTSVTAIFTSSMVGHLVSCIKTPLSGTAAQAFSSTTATVTSFVNSSTVTYSGSNAGTQTGMYCSILNPADPPALLAAFNAAKSNVQAFNGGDVSAYQTIQPIVYLPSGVYGLGQTLDNLISTGSEQCVGFLGEGLTRTGIVPTANFAPKASSIGYIINGRCSGGYLRDFFVDQLSLPINPGGTSNQAALNLTGPNTRLSDVSVVNGCNVGAGVLYGMFVGGGTNVLLSRPTIINGGCGGQNGGLLWSGAEGDVYSPFLSNTQQNLLISSQPSGSGGSGMRVWGGVVDEGSITTIQTSVDVWLIGTTLTGGTNCLSVDGTSVVTYIGGYCGTFATNTGGGPTVATGGQLYVTNVHVRAQNNPSACWNGTGQIFDGGGNICTTAGGGVIYGASTSPVIFPLQSNATTQLGGRQTVNGNVPTGCAITGNDTSTCAFDTGSTDAAGRITITAAGTTTAIGTVAFSFSSTLGTHSSTCSANYLSGSAAWAIAAVAPIFLTNTTAGTSFNINNAGVNLTAGQTYKINYTCYGQ